MSKPDSRNEEDVKRAAELREWLESRIQETEAELGRLRDMQLVVDSVLRKSSFVPAAELKSTQISKQTQRGKTIAADTSVANVIQETRQLRRSKDGLLIANAFVGPSSVVIVPSSDVKVAQDLAPFQTFFVNRILKGFESKDQEFVSSGKISQSEILTYSVEEAGGSISKITVNNYRDNSRLSEILSTANWALTRMLEKK
ncbi:MAG: hypothetical protein JRN20_11185 [Nitrososphaerota archaeon]|nr:hypothetical protein [Nitrososphaerota archaeon]MDG6923032.1 hypothetical protein [Nitrososphaerota archaeon]